VYDVGLPVQVALKISVPPTVGLMLVAPTLHVTFVLSAAGAQNAGGGSAAP
jgi:hypothetical protein